LEPSSSVSMSFILSNFALDGSIPHGVNARVFSFETPSVSELMGQEPIIEIAGDKSHE